MNNFYIYILIDPRDNTPFYVGKGKAKRYQSHEKEYVKQLDYLATHYEAPEKMLSLKEKVFHELKLENLQYEYKLIEELNGKWLSFLTSCKYSKMR